ncbi:unnamed protein product, partial [Iphiclides podalirius]
MEQSLEAKLASICLISQYKLEKILTACGEKTDLIIDASLIKPLERICGVTWLRQHGVEKIYKMDPHLGQTANTTKIYFISACIQKYKCVLDQISSQLSQNPSMRELKCFNIIIVPKVLQTYDSILESRAFGYKFMYVFNNLINAGLLVQPSSPKLSLNISNLSGLSDRLPRWQSSFQNQASKLKQLPSPEDSKASPGYVFNGSYVPLVAVICKALLTSESLTEALNKLSPLAELKLGGGILEHTRDGIETLNEKLSNIRLQTELEYGCREARSLLKLLKSDAKLAQAFSLRTKSVLVFVVGGVTYAEVAACDVIQKATGGRVYVASDCIASGSDYMAANT